MFVYNSTNIFLFNLNCLILHKQIKNKYMKKKCTTVKIDDITLDFGDRGSSSDFKPYTLYKIKTLLKKNFDKHINYVTLLKQICAKGIIDDNGIYYVKF